jgi:type IV fimbrial biogenesis protein FimT
MVVIVMIAVVLGVAIANYQHFTTSNTVVAELHALKQDITLARSQAATLGGNVLVCASSNPGSTTPSCSGTNEWNTGWAVVVPSNGSCTATTGSPVAAQAALRSQNTIVFVPSAGGTAPTSLCFNRYGLPTGQTVSGLFVFNTKTPDAGDRLCLGVNSVGHLQTFSSGQGGCP